VVGISAGCITIVSGHRAMHVLALTAIETILQALSDCSRSSGVRWWLGAVSTEVLTYSYRLMKICPITTNMGVIHEMYRTLLEEKG
jgi:hypothetical protein